MKSNTKNTPERPNAPQKVFGLLTPSERRRLDASMVTEIRRLERCRRQIGRIDLEVFKAGISCFESASVLARWLCEPAVGLGGKVPLQVMRTQKGRKDVANLLRRIDYGVY